MSVAAVAVQSLFLEMRVYICICILCCTYTDRCCFWSDGGGVGGKERGGVRGDWEGGGDAWGMWDWDLIGIVCHVVMRVVHNRWYARGHVQCSRV